jgi:hypothetical protein
MWLYDGKVIPVPQQVAGTTDCLEDKTEERGFRLKVNHIGTQFN